MSNMTNAGKYKSVEGRIAAHNKWCEKNAHHCDHKCAECAFRWLEQSSDESSEEQDYVCPKCKGDVILKHVIGFPYDSWWFECSCGYRTARQRTLHRAKEELLIEHGDKARA